MYTSLHEPQLIQEYYTEYLKTINRYHNITRNSLFIKYHNINEVQSIYDEKDDATYDIYNISNIVFDVYDFTPAYFTAPVLNRSANVIDLQGHLLDGSGTLTVYTIKKPMIHDIITFYPPINASEIFRVVNISTPTNALHAQEVVSWFELEIEYAPLKTVNNLKLNKNYVYDISNEKNILYEEYEQLISKLNKIGEFLEFINKYYDGIKDVYRIDDLIPFCLNDIIIYIKKHYNNYYRRIFEKTKSPYNFQKYVPNEYIIGKLDNQSFADTVSAFNMFSLTEDKQIEYIWAHDQNIPNNNIDEVLLKVKQMYLELVNYGTL